MPPHKKGDCGWLFSGPVVSADGRVYACACMDVEAELSIGNMDESSMQDIWFGGRHIEIIESYENGDFPDVCQRCRLYASIYNRHRTTRPDKIWNATK